MFPRKRTFFRPFIITVILVIAANYLGPTRGTGLLYMVIAFIVYGIFLIRLYFRLARSFGKSVPFALGMSFFPIIFLPILAFGKSAYLGKPEFKPRRQHSKPVRILLNACYALISVAEVLLLIAVVGFFTIRALPPRILVNTILNDFYASTSGITGGDSIVTREDALGEDAAIIDTLPVSRAHFVEDHSADQNAVVITYIVGSNLENRSGLATANIHQMMEASQKGSGLTFVIQAGGSERWFTDGIEDSSYGRYTIQDGQLTKVQELDSSISMADPAQFADFLAWTRDNYPADRYMLVLWDHGGGVPNGYGLDDLHERSDGDTVLSVSEIRDAIDQSGIRFDLIGFDACLMQDIEIAAALEPYADYYLASEETEGGYGWYYTTAFGLLAENPGISTPEFARELVATYDPYNTIIKDEDGAPDTQATISLVDLTLAKPAYQELCKVFKSADAAIRDDSANYASMSLAAMNS